MAGKVPLSEQLGADAFDTDSTTHLTLSDPALCQSCREKPCIRVCPAEVYSWDSDRLRIRYENCLETGACRIACEKLGNRALVWAFPNAGRGVQYRLG